jgi:hypothetical protein
MSPIPSRSGLPRLHRRLLPAAVALIMTLVPATVAAIDPLPGEVGASLEPGTYVDNSLGFFITFEVGEGWRQGFTPSPQYGIELTTEDHQTWADSWSAVDNLATLSLVPFDGEVYAQGYCVPAGGSEDSFLGDLTTIESTPAAMADHLASNPLLEITDPTEVEIAGFSGLALTATAHVGEDCALPKSMLWNGWELVDGFSDRILLLDVNGSMIIAVMETSPDVDLETFAAEAQPVLESLTVVPM